MERTSLVISVFNPKTALAMVMTSGFWLLNADFGCLMQQWPRHVHNPCVGSERVTSPTRNTDTSPFEVLLMRRFSGIFEVTNLTSCEPFKNCQDFAGSGVSMRRIDAPWCVVNAGHGDARSVEPWRQCYIHSW